MVTEVTPAGISRDRLRALPQSSGVYLMKDKQGTVIYVGKSKNLRARVNSYFNKGDGRENVQFLMERVVTIETLVTDGERQALVLESDLIKKYRPRYNLRLKDDKAYLLVRIDLNHEWPKLELVRSAKEDGARYIGPFAFSYELRTILEVIKKTVPLRTCSDNVIYNRTRPCLQYQIKQCAAPCCLEVDRTQYLEWIEQAANILQGRTEDVRLQLEQQMEKASEELRFEDAAAVRDRLEILKRVREERQISQFGDLSVDVFGLYREGHNLELSVLLVRRGRIFEAKTFGFSEVEVPDEELLSSLLVQFYAGETLAPATIVVPLEFEDCQAQEELFSDKRGAKVEILCPQRGSKARLLSLAKQNAKENFEARFSGVSKSERVLQGLKNELELEEVPRIIECVDVSHFQGGATVASVVSFSDGKPDKKRYRHFHLTQEGKPDDFASMREVLMRHLSRAAEENRLPDLVVIDGGPGQLSQALAVRRELGLQKPEMIGLAKKRAPVFAATSSYSSFHKVRKPERIYSEGGGAPLVLDGSSEILHLLERVRNEAHRFAIAFHRATRTKRTFRSALDGIPGIGQRRKFELLRAFQSIKALREATAEEISFRARIPLKMAERLKLFLDKERQS